MRRADDGAIDLEGARLANVDDGPGLEEVEELRLKAQVHVADLVEEERAVIRARDRATPRGGGRAIGEAE